MNYKCKLGFSSILPNHYRSEKNKIAMEAIKLIEGNPDSIPEGMDKEYFLTSMRQAADQEMDQLVRTITLDETDNIYIRKVLYKFPSCKQEFEDWRKRFSEDLFNSFKKNMNFKSAFFCKEPYPEFVGNLKNVIWVEIKGSQIYPPQYIFEFKNNKEDVIQVAGTNDSRSEEFKKEFYNFIQNIELSKL